MLELGFYCGLAMLYPYAPVYCVTENCRGGCYGSIIYSAKSAPLPLDYKWCEGTDLLIISNKNWYQWKPRILLPDSVKHIGAERICYWEDRGEAKDMNDLER